MVKQEDLLKMFEYKETGDLLRIGRSNPEKRKPHRTGYTYVKIKQKPYGLHRLIYMLHKGEIPKGIDIDHIDGDLSNNRIENLRPVTHAQNMWNKRSSRNSTCGLIGVSFSKPNKKYCAQIRQNGKTFHLGYFPCPIPAYLAYREAKKKYQVYINPIMKTNRNN